MTEDALCHFHFSFLSVFIKTYLVYIYTHIINTTYIHIYIYYIDIIIYNIIHIQCNTCTYVYIYTSTKGRTDPLEQVLYFTSVGVPSYVYDTAGDPDGSEWLRMVQNGAAV